MSDRASPSPLPTPQQECASLTACSISTSTRQIPDTVDTQVQVKEEETTTLPSPTTSVTRTESNADAPPRSPTRAARKTEGQRRAFLRNDPQAQEVEPRRVLCRVCERWIKLSGACSYSASNWLAHKQRCTPATPVLRTPRRTPSKPNFSPSSRVATAERKIVLFNDPQVKVFSPRRVQCGKCMSVVVLEGTVDYELTKWTEHKETCIPVAPAPITPRGPPPRPPRSASPQDEPRRSPSPVCETTPAVQAGTKREREEEEVEDERPTNRARTEEPRLIGLLMEPLREFARGFRQGLGSN